MIKAEKLKVLIEKEATIYYCNAEYGFTEEFNLKGCELYNDFDSTDLVYENEPYDLGNLYETKSEAEFYAKYGNVEKTVKMPVPPTWEETKIKDFIKSNKTKPDNYKELFAFYLNNELFNLEIYSDENCKYFITISDDKNYYKPLFKMPLTKYNYYKALDKMVELWREEVCHQQKNKHKII